jgi:hypothetical protein
MVKKRPSKLIWALLVAVGISPAASLFFLFGWTRSEAKPGAPVRFVDVARKAGIPYAFSVGIQDLQALTILQTMGNGAAFLDVNRDGNLDVLLVDAKPKLYQGNGKGRFREVSAAYGLTSLSGHFQGCAVGDYDNDGFEDLYLSGYRTGVLLRNRGGKRFQNVSQAAGIHPERWGTSCGFADLNQDGRLDLFVANYVQFGPDPSRYLQRCEPLACGPKTYDPELPTLYRNVGGGRFRDVSEASGIHQSGGKGLGVAFADFDDDGDQDIMVANDMVAGDLFRNEGNFRFTNIGIDAGVAYGPDGDTQGGMGVDWGDADGDGRLDAIVTTYQEEPKSLYRNGGEALFTNITHATTLGKATAPYVGFGARWLDYDNDGWQDLLIANGNVDNKIHQMFPNRAYRQPTQAFRNLGGKRFAEDGNRLGPALQKLIVGRGLATGDYDNDGRVDALVIDDDGPVLLLHNEGEHTANWIGLTLVGAGKSNRNALGARVTLTAGKRSQVREVQTAGSYLSASDRRLHFGLGAENCVPEISVRWPDGRMEIFRDLAINQYHALRQNTARDDTIAE